MKQAMRTFGILALGALLSCGTPVSKNSNSGTNNVNNVNNTTGLNSMVFELNNVGKSSVFVTPRPLTIYDGDTALATNIYPCACGLACPAVEPAPIQEIRPGGGLSWNWDGSIDLGGSCSADGMVGKNLEAEFCYGRSFEGSNATFDGTPTDIVCERVPFTVEPACPDRCGPVMVELTVDSMVRPVTPPLLLVLDNQSAASVYIQLSQDCSAGTWFQILHNDEPLLLTQPCGLCDCSEGPNCVGGCTGACLQDQAVEVHAGTTYEVELAGKHLAVYDDGDTQCTQEQFMPDPLVAEICYGSDAVDNLVSNVTCGQTEFLLSDREARVVVTGS